MKRPRSLPRSRLTIKSGSGWTAVVIFEGDGRGGTPELRRRLDGTLSAH